MDDYMVDEDSLPGPVELQLEGEEGDLFWVLLGDGADVALPGDDVDDDGDDPPSSFQDFS